MSKLTFALSSLAKYAVRQSSTCPYCGSATRILQRKHLLLQLRRCDRCALQFRYPRDEPEQSKRFYQVAYKQGSTTELPPEVSTHFSGVRDAADDLKTIQPLVPSGKLLDYGCSWGYCTRQFIEAGYDAEGFEISEPRAQYGRGTLGLRITSDITDFEDSSFDVIYTAHVLEHIPTPKATLNEFRRLLKPGGMLFLYVPNCGGKRARDQGVHWGPMMGEKHVLSLTAEFFLRNLPAHGFDVSQPTDPDGDELRVIARRGTE